MNNDQPIEQLDPFMPLYVMEKMTNPEKKMELRQFKTSDVMFVDKMLQLTGHRPTVATTQDWDNLREVVQFYAIKWPEEFIAFRRSIDDIRNTRGKGGYSQSREIKYVAALPPKLERIITILYPKQEFNKEFVNKLAKRLPVFKVGGEKN